MSRKATIVILWAAALALRAPLLHAQFDTAAVLGTIRDSSGGVVSGAAVTLRNVNTGIAAKSLSDAAGNFEFLDVKAGTYMLEAAAVGFSTSVAEAFPVAVSARQRVDLTLRVGAVTDKVTSPARPTCWNPTPAGAARRLDTNRWWTCRSTDGPTPTWRF